MRVLFDPQVAAGQWPSADLMTLMTTPDTEQQRSLINPIIVTLGLASACLITLADDRLDEMSEVSRRTGVADITAQRLSVSLADFAVKATSYFADNITCLSVAETFAPAEAQAACGQLTHAAIVAAKRAPHLLWQETISNAVANGFDNFRRLPEGARHDQDLMVDSLIKHLTVTAPTETPAHLSTLADAIVSWSRKQDAAEDDPRPAPTARAEACARLIYNRLGLSADAHINPVQSAA